MADNSTPFDEQIRVSLDMAALEGQFKQIADLWKSTLAEMGTSGPGLVDTLNVGTINAQLKDLSGTLAGFVENFQESLGTIGATINEALGTTTQKAAEAANKSASYFGERNVKLLKDIEIEQEGVLKSTLEANEKEIAAFEKKAEREKALAREIAQERQAILEEYSRQQEAMYAKLFAEQEANQNALAKFNNARRNEEITPTGGPGAEAELTALNKQLALEEKVAIQRAKLARDIAIEQEGVANAHEAANEKMARSDDELFAKTQAKYEKLAADRRRINDQVLADIYKAENEAAKNTNEGFNQAGRGGSGDATLKSLNEQLAAEEKLAAVREKSAQAQKNLAREIATEQEGLQNKYNESLAAPAGFVSSLLRDIPELIAGVVRFQLGWALVGSAIQGVTELIKAPFQILKDGIAELSQIEDKAVELSGVLATSFNFSSDFAKNLQLASQYSKVVADELQNVAAQSGLKFDSLTNVFKILSNSGIAGFSKDLGQVVALSQQFATLLHAGGIESESTRRILSEIPKLLNGSVKGNELLLTSLGLTKEQWVGIVSEAKEHGDLVQRLAPYIAPYVAQLEATKGTLSSLKAQFKEAFDADAAAVADGVFGSLKASLQTIIGLLKNSREEFRDLGGLLGDLVQSFAHLLDISSLFGKNTENLGSPFKNLIGYIERMTAGLSVMAEIGAFFLKQLDAFEAKITKNLRGLYQMSSGLGNIVSGQFTKGATDIAQSSLTFKENPDKELEAARNGRDERIKQIQENYASAIANLRSAESLKSSGTDLQDAQFDGGKGVPPATGGGGAKGNQLSLFREQMQDRLSLLKEQTQAGVDMAKEDFAARKIGEQELHDFVITLLQDEKKQVTEIMKEYKDNIAGASNVKPDQRSQALGGASRLEGTTQASIDHQITSTNIQLDNEQYANKIRLLQGQYEFEAKIAQQSIDLARRSGSSQEEIVRLQSAASEKEYQNRRHLLELELAEYQNVAEKKVEIQQRMAQLDKANSARQEIDRQSNTNARVRDEILAAQQLEAAQKATFDAERRNATDPRLGDINPQAQRDRITALAEAYEKMTAAQLANISAIKAGAEARKADASILKEIDALYQKAAANESAAKSTLNRAERNSQVSGDFWERIFGSGARSIGDFGKKETTDDRGNTVVKPFDATTAAKQLSNALNIFGNQVSSIVAAFKSGGALKGLGALGQTAGADISQLMPDSALGPIIGIAGQVISLISDAFTAGARKIADNIKKAFSITMETFQEGGATLATTVTAVQNEMNQAIAQLSGKKGGQDQLNQILPQLRQQLYQLQLQAAQTQFNFMMDLAKLDAGNLDPLNSMIDSWTQINQKVKDYISAGGDAINAQRYLSESLASFKKEMSSQFSQENEQAVQDALSLNDLLQQRIDMEYDEAQAQQQYINQQKQYAQQRFQSVNADALERRASNAVTTGTALQQQQAEQALEQQQYDRQQAAYQRQLESLNSEIVLGQQKVDLEKQIFDIATSRADLLSQSNALQIKQLNDQLLIWKQQKEVIDNIITTAGGDTLLTSWLANRFGAGPISTPGSSIVINVTVEGNANAQQISNEILQALDQSGRYGTGTDIQTFNN